MFLSRSLRVLGVFYNPQTQPTKINILATKFFSLTEKINLQNITDNESVTHQLNIEKTVITDQMKQVIRSLFTEKTANSDNVLNEILKMTCEIIKKNLTVIITQYFTNSLLSLCLKEFTTMMLCKKRKKNYFLSDSYCLIVLKNTIVKLLEKIVTEHITNTAEKHDLFI